MADRIFRRCSYPDKFLQETFSTTLIPGPAGVLQITLSRKKNKDPMSFNTQGEPIPTQEFLRKAAKEPHSEDKDFSKYPWFAIVDYIRSEGLLSNAGNGIWRTLGEIKRECTRWSKVDQVMAIVETFTPNGHGDFMMTLKDPSGTINASVHRKGIDTELGREIQVGAVVILKQVTVCRLSSSTTCLNITSKNIYKVIRKDYNPVLQEWTDDQLEELFRLD